MDIVGTRRGEIYFARTTVMWGQIAAGTTIHGVAMFDGWAIAHGWRKPGRKMFRPYIHGAAAWGGRAITTCGRLRIIGADGRKIFRPHIHGAVGR